MEPLNGQWFLVIYFWIYDLTCGWVASKQMTNYFLASINDWLIDTDFSFLVFVFIYLLYVHCFCSYFLSVVVCCLSIVCYHWSICLSLLPMLTENPSSSQFRMIVCPSQHQLFGGAAVPSEHGRTDALMMTMTFIRFSWTDSGFRQVQREDFQSRNCWSIRHTWPVLCTWTL